MNKLITIIAACLAFGAGFFFVFSSKPRPPKQLASAKPPVTSANVASSSVSQIKSTAPVVANAASAPAPESVPATVGASAYPAFQLLHGETLAAVSFTRTALERDFAPLNTLWGSFLKTSLARKLEIKPSLLDNLAANPQLNKTPVDLSAANSKNIEDLLIHWRTLDRALVSVVLDPARSPEPQQPVDALVQLSFVSDAAVQDLQKALNDAIDSKKQTGDVTIAKDPQSSARYFVQQAAKDGVPAKELGALTFAARTVSFTYGTRETKDFFVTDPNLGLTSTADWKALTPAVQGPDELVFFGRPSRGMAVFRQLKTQLSNPAFDDQLAQFETQWGSLRGVIFASAPRFSSHYCMDLDAASDLAKYYAAWLPRRDSAQPLHAKLVNEQTVLALLTRASDPAALGQYYMSYGLGSAQNAPGATPELKEQLKVVENAVTRLAFKEYGIAVEAPAGLDVPNAYISLVGSPLSGDALLKEFSDSVNSIASVFMPGMQLASLGKGPDGTSRVMFQPMGPVALVAAPFGASGVIVATHDAALQGAQNAVKASSSYLERLKPSEGSSAGMSQDAISMNYVNTAPLIQTAKMFAPMFVPQPLPNGVELEDIFEAANLLNGKAKIESAMAPTAGSILCGETRVTPLGL